jgi:hypothetical protein
MGIGRRWNREADVHRRVEASCILANNLAGGGETGVQSFKNTCFINE